jgi:cellulase/cellobiase CelA1
MRPAPAILLAALTVATLLPLGQHPAAASCAGPYLTDAGHLMLQRGTTVEIDGAAFANGCQDTGSCSAMPGCSSCDYGPDPTPMRNITLTLRQHGRTWPLGTADARVTQDGFGAVTWAVEIPADVKIGWATLVPEYGQPAKVRVG